MLKKEQNTKPVIISVAGDDFNAWVKNIAEIIPYNPGDVPYADICVAALVTDIEHTAEFINLRNENFYEAPIFFAGEADKTPSGVDAVILPPYDQESLEIWKPRFEYLNLVCRELGALRNRLRYHEIFSSIIGESKPMMELFDSMSRVVDFDVNVLITGESGTGKELVARAIHDGSSRKNGPFIEVNCAGISFDIADSLLFGHVKGAFTGANYDHTGFFEQADKGTIFLDEIGELHLDVQSKLLRILENRKVRRVGGKTEREVDFRVISATNRLLSEERTTKRFRDDLYFRLEQFTIKVPPLRERKEDIRILARHFVNEICSFYELGKMVFSENVLRGFELKDWPGNVRELRHHVQKLALKSLGSIIVETDITEPVESGRKHEIYSDDSDIIPLTVLEQREIEKAFKKFNGNIDRTSMALGISRATLYRKLKIYGIM